MVLGPVWSSLRQPATLEARGQLGCLALLPAPQMLSDPVLGPSSIVTLGAGRCFPSCTPKLTAKSQRSRKAKRFADMAETSPGTSRKWV